MAWSLLHLHARFVITCFVMISVSLIEFKCHGHSNRNHFFLVKYVAQRGRVFEIALFDGGYVLACENQNRTGFEEDQFSFNDDEQNCMSLEFYFFEISFFFGHDPKSQVQYIFNLHSAGIMQILGHAIMQLLHLKRPKLIEHNVSVFRAQAWNELVRHSLEYPVSSSKRAFCEQWQA